MRNKTFSLLEVNLWILTISACVLFGSVHQWVWPFWGLFLFFPLLFYPNILFEISALPKLFSFTAALAFLWAATQAIFVALDKYAAAQEILRWFLYGTAFLFMRSLSRESLIRWLWALLFLGIFEAVYGIFQVQSGYEQVLWQVKEAHRGFATGTFLNRNHYAGLLELCLGSGVGLLLHSFYQGRKLQSVGIAGGLFVILAALMQSASRMGIMSFLVATFFFFLLLMKSPKKFPQMGFVVGGVFILASLGLAQEAFSLRFIEIQDRFSQWEGGRFLVWKDALAILNAHLWSGVGLGNFVSIYPSYQSAALVMKWAHAHNDYLELLVELGALGFFVLMFFWSHFFFDCIRRLRALEANVFFLAAGILLAMTSLVIHGIADFNFAVPSNMLIFVMLAGTLSKLCEEVS